MTHERFAVSLLVKVLHECFPSLRWQATKKRCQPVI
jgi:hypothetical protein